MFIVADLVSLKQEADKLWSQSISYSTRESYKAGVRCFFTFLTMPCVLFGPGNFYIILKSFNTPYHTLKSVSKLEDSYDLLVGNEIEFLPDMILLLHTSKRLFFFLNHL